jgi:glycosyltransferase involved in cell wall biosynthesis
MARQGRHEYVALLPEMPQYAGLSSPGLRVMYKPSFRQRNLVLREWWLNVAVPKLCREERADGLFCLGNLTPHHPSVPTVVLLQQALYVYQEARARQGFTLRQWLVFKYGCHQFRHLAGNVTVVVQLEAMKERFVSLYPIAASRVHVIRDRGLVPHALAGSCRRSDRDGSAPFAFLCVAAYNPHKNLEVLVEAVKRLRILTKRPFRCLLTVQADQHPGAKKLLNNIEREGLGDVLVCGGLLDPERLSTGYRSADAFILPTLFESFGRPYGEAMQFDLPILTSDRDFARERCRDAALYFDPLDAGSVALAMLAIMEDKDLRSRLVENGRRILEETPTWDEVAARFVELLERAASGQLTTDGRSRSQDTESRAQR